MPGTMAAFSQFHFLSILTDAFCAAHQRLSGADDKLALVRFMLLPLDDREKESLVSFSVKRKPDTAEGFTIFAVNDI